MSKRRAITLPPRQVGETGTAVTRPAQGRGQHGSASPYASHHLRAHAQRYAQEALFGLGTDIYHYNTQGITNSYLAKSQSGRSGSYVAQSSLTVPESAALKGLVSAFASGGSSQDQIQAIINVVRAFTTGQRRRRRESADGDEGNNDEIKTYRTDWKIAIVFAVGLAGWVLIGITEAVNTGVFVKSSLGATALVSMIALLITRLTYASISGTILRYVDLFFSRRIIDINSITEINDQSTYKVAKSQFRSLYIFYNNRGETEWIELRITIFPEKELGRLIKDLKEINPRIELNQYCQKLMESAS
jgi:hypothetical protein